MLSTVEHASHLKKTKIFHITPEVLVQITNKQGELVPIRALCDSGTTSTILL